MSLRTGGEGSAATQVRLCPRAYREIEQIVAHSRAFDTVEAYVNFVLETLLFGEPDSAGADNEDNEEQILESRLKDLGYL
ncbi:MAG: hypothetical protein ACE5IY_13175 [bacterium]